MCISLQMKWTELYHMISNVQKNRRVAQKSETANSCCKPLKKVLTSNPKEKKTYINAISESHNT